MATKVKVFAYPTIKVSSDGPNAGVYITFKEKDAEFPVLTLDLYREEVDALIDALVKENNLG